MRSRELSVVLVVLGCIAGLVAHAGWWTRSTLLDEDGFAETVVQSMDRTELRRALSAVIVENVIEGAEPRLVAARPIVQGAVDTVLSSSAFATALDAAAVDIHRSVFDESAPTVTVQVTRLVTQAQDLVRNVDPELANAPGWQQASELPLLTAEYVEAARSADRMSQIATYSSTVLAALLLGVAVWISSSRRRTAADIGAGLLAIGGVTIVVVQLASIEADRRLSGDLAVIAAETYDAFTGSLISRSLWLGALGLLVIAATSARNPDHPPPSILAPVHLAREAIQARELKEHPVLKSIGLVVVGVALVFFRDEVIPLLVIAIGAWVAFVGLYGVFDVIGRAEERRGSTLVSPRAVVVAIISVLLIAAVLIALQGRDVIDVVGSDDECNGHAALCDKRFDEVTLPATHNSMAAARQAGWFSPYQNNTIREQLDDGIRGLLIDVHYGRRGPGGTVFTSNDAPANQQISEQERARLETLQRQREQATLDERQPYLCHAFCELGATPLSDALTDVHDFLEDNQREVVIIFVEDNVPAAEFERVANEVGIAPLAFTYKGSWPTLREMIAGDQRLVVLSESQVGPPEWYMNGFALAQDTPFDAPSLPELSCRANRGNTDASLLLMNHWVAQTPPDRALASRANSYETLNEEVRECQATRGKSPNVIAVDFYESGDLFRVVDELNGS